MVDANHKLDSLRETIANYVEQRKKHSEIIRKNKISGSANRDQEN